QQQVVDTMPKIDVGGPIPVIDSADEHLPRVDGLRRQPDHGLLPSRAIGVRDCGFVVGSPGPLVTESPAGSVQQPWHQQTPEITSDVTRVLWRTMTGS